MGAEIRCIAHRGDNKSLPENTHAAFESALNYPIDGLELDVRITADDVLVVYHNRTPVKAGGEDRPIADQTLAELQRLNYGDGESLPLLDEVLTRYGRRTNLLVEIKADEGSGGRDKQQKLMTQTMDAVCRHGLEKTAMVLSFDLDLLAFGHARYPEVRCVLNQNGGLAGNVPFLYAHSFKIDGLEPEHVAEAHKAGKPVFCWTCNDEQQVNHALRCGVEGIMSDNPEWLTDYILSNVPSTRVRARD